MNGLSPMLMGTTRCGSWTNVLSVPSAGGRESMKQKHAAYPVVPYPKMRRLEALAYRSVQQKRMIHGLIEVDVTRARAPQRA
jgi:hypothetical protein